MHGYDMYPRPSDVAVNFHWSKNKSDQNDIDIRWISGFNPTIMDLV